MHTILSYMAIPGVLINNNPKDIIKQIEEFTKQKIDIKTRKREVVEARQIAMYVIKCRTKLSFAEIGGLCGGKDHATVLHSIKTVKNVCDTDRAFNHKVIAIRDIIRLKFKPEINDKE